MLSNEDLYTPSMTILLIYGVKVWTNLKQEIINLNHDIYIYITPSLENIDLSRVLVLETISNDINISFISIWSNVNFLLKNAFIQV